MEKLEKLNDTILTFFAFAGTSENAMNFYVSVFPDSKIISVDYFKKGERGEEGKVLNGTFELMGKKFMVLDMEKQYAVPFSWSISQFVICRSENEFDSLFAKLSEGGTVMMGPEQVNQLRKVSWVTDKFGVTWQLVWQ